MSEKRNGYHACPCQEDLGNGDGVCLWEDGLSGCGDYACASRDSEDRLNKTTVALNALIEERIRMNYNIEADVDPLGKPLARFVKEEEPKKEGKKRGYPKMCGVSSSTTDRAKEIFYSMQQSPAALDFVLNYVAHMAYANGFDDATRVHRGDTID